MPPTDDFILGEFRRTIDERFRLSVPTEFVSPLTAEGTTCVLAKERPGSLSLWSPTTWQSRLDDGIQVVRSKFQRRRLEDRTEEIQLLGRLLSTRHREVELAGRGRLLIPEGFREFLGVEPGGEVMVVGAAVCVEIWSPRNWISHLEEKMPDFGKLINELAG
jgi:MraZ protein